MSTATGVADAPGGRTASGKGSVLCAHLRVDTERQILLRVQRGGMHIGEGELRYQLERKDRHPLARADALLDLMADLEDRGLVESELWFRLTREGRERLAELAEGV